MKMFALNFTAFCLLILPAFGQDSDLRQLNRLEGRITRTYEGLELHKTDRSDVPDNPGWVLRSRHFVFGMPRLVDRRHDFVPETGGVKRPGVSVLVREGFVVAHFDRMRVPLFVCQRWTRADYHRMEAAKRIGRNWKPDLELPMYARADGTSYNYQETSMQRGHMARHEDNHAWGADSANFGCLMSNSAPQHRKVNMGKGWRDLEDALQEIVNDGSDIEVIWTISGTLYRDSDNPEDEQPEDDFQKAGLIGDGFRVPQATYKIVGWFDGRGYFQARGYVFEQGGSDPEPDPDPKEHLTPIDEIEKRAAVDFFPLLKDYIEDLIEKQTYGDMWGAKEVRRSESRTERLITAQ